jgi:predicted nucleic acid-binding protein
VKIVKMHRLAVYDASYVELARRITLPLATRDKAMIAAARQIGIDVIEA